MFAIKMVDVSECRVYCEQVNVLGVHKQNTIQMYSKLVREVGFEPTNS